MSGHSQRRDKEIRGQNMRLEQEVGTHCLICRRAGLYPIIEENHMKLSNIKMTIAFVFFKYNSDSTVWNVLNKRVVAI